MDKNNLIFSRVNYILMVVGVFILIIGLYIMMLDKEAYGFGSLGITVGPIVLLLGLIVEFFAIFYKPKKQ